MRQWIGYTPRLLAATLAVFGAVTLAAMPASADPSRHTPLPERTKSDAHLARCIDWMLTDYPSGLEETACAAYFGLPSSFLFKCARAQKLGYRSTTQRRACVLFFAKASKQAESGYVQN